MSDPGSAGLGSTHSITVVVADSDIDELGHASNIAYVRWIQEVALAHSAAVGLDVEAYQRIGCVFFVRRHEIDYLRPALRGESLEVRTWIATAMAAKCTRGTTITNAAGTVLMRSITTWGFVEMTTGRPTRIPDDIRIAFGTPPRSVNQMSSAAEMDPASAQQRKPVE